METKSNFTLSARGTLFTITPFLISKIPFLASLAQTASDAPIECPELSPIIFKTILEWVINDYTLSWLDTQRQDLQIDEKEWSTQIAYLGVDLASTFLSKVHTGHVVWLYDPSASKAHVSTPDTVKKIAYGYRELEVC